MPIYIDKLETLSQKVNELHDKVSIIQTHLEEVSSNISAESEVIQLRIEDDDERSVYHNTAKIISNVLKLKYALGNDMYDKWEEDIRQSRDKLDMFGILNKRNRDLSNYYINIFDDVYDYAIQLYDASMKREEGRLTAYRSMIPPTCPFDEEEILLDPIWKLLNKLPDPKELLTQMQLYNFCCINGSSDAEKRRNISLCLGCEYLTRCKSLYRAQNTRD